MACPIVIAHHLIWTAYGWWLPNDPRGSTSRAIRSELIAGLGRLHQGRKRVQPASSEIRGFYNEAAGTLTHPLLRLDAEDTTAAAEAFAQTIAQERYTCYACAIMPDHVHLLIRKHKHQAEQMIENLQTVSRLRLSASGRRVDDHPVWARGGWKVFLDHPDDVRRTMRYVGENPCHISIPEQEWPFVTECDDWPLHQGHNPNSPYAKALRRAGRYPQR